MTDFTLLNKMILGDAFVLTKQSYFPTNEFKGWSFIKCNKCHKLLVTISELHTTKQKICYPDGKYRKRKMSYFVHNVIPEHTCEILYDEEVKDPGCD